MDKALKRHYSNPKNFKQLVWDYKMTPHEFFEILAGKKDRTWLGQDWAMARVLQNLNYYDAISLVPISQIKDRWKKLRNQLFPESFRILYDFVLHQYSLSSSR